MVKTASTMLSLGTQAPDFSLANVDGRMVSRSDFVGQPLLVVFMCNHCPFVVHVRQALREFGVSIKPKAWQWWASAVTTNLCIPRMVRTG